LASDIAKFGSDSTYASLYPVIEGENPDDSYS